VLPALTIGSTTYEAAERAEDADIMGRFDLNKDADALQSAQTPEQLLDTSKLGEAAVVVVQGLE